MSEQKRTSSRPAVGPRRGPGAHGGRIEKAKDARGSLHRLATYLKPHKASLILVFVLVIIYTALALVGPYLMGVAIDQYISVRNADGLLRIVLIMLAAYLLSAGGQALANFIMANVSQKTLQSLRRDLFEHLQTLSLSFFDKNPHGELMSRLTNDIDAINRAVSQNVTQLMNSAITVVGILVTMFILNPWLALASLITIPLMVLVTAALAKRTRSGFRSLQTDLGTMNGQIEESVSGQRVVSAFRRTEDTKQDFDTINQKVYDSSIQANTFAFLLMPLTGIMNQLNIGIIAGLGAYLAVQGIVTVGTVATFITYSQRFTEPMRSLANMYNTIQSALAGAERVFEIIDTKPELKDAPEAMDLKDIKGDVVFDHVDFGYLKDVPVLKDVNLHAKPGQTFALVGPTGAGKTTIVNLLTRFYDIDGGRITIDGKDICRVKKADLRRQLGIVLQDTFLFSASVMENIRYGRLDATDEEVIEAAKLADADHFIRHLPQGYETELSERASNLSQGQRQLLAIARAVLADPAILVLDEATSSVDTRTELRIQKGLLRLMEGRTSFVIAHRLSTIREADQVLVIDNGELIERGNHEELLDKKGFYYNLYVSQFRGQAAAG
jgi:ATP-binding cassette, subfamily B, multidrug efflux pump